MRAVRSCTRAVAVTAIEIRAGRWRRGCDRREDLQIFRGHLARVRAEHPPVMQFQSASIRHRIFLVPSFSMRVRLFGESKPPLAIASPRPGDRDHPRTEVLAANELRNIARAHHLDLPRWTNCANYQLRHVLWGRIFEDRRRSRRRE